MNLKVYLRNKYYDTLIGRLIKSIYYFFRKNKLLEKKISLGEKNSKETVYIIRPNSEDGVQGLMSLFIQTLRKIDYAKRKKFIPVVDFKNYNTQYYDGKNNAWEMFFLQPTNTTIEDAYQSKNVILSGVSVSRRENFDLFKSTIFDNDEICEYCHKLIEDNIKYNEDVLKKVTSENKNLEVEKCIGVYIRGTDYTKLKPAGEYVQPTIEEVIEKIDEFLKKDNNISIFLVTEDLENYTVLKNKYKEKLKIVSYDVFIDRNKVDNFLSKTNVLKENTKDRGTDYLVKILLLSRCKYLISSITYGSIATYAINGNKYKEKYIFNKGVYK